jgi:hypothetical protein
MVACFATAESLLYSAEARDYVLLADGLEVTAMPRLGPLASPGHIRALSGTGPAFLVSSFKPGDRIYFVKQASQGVGAVTDCTVGSIQVNGDITSAIPSSNSAMSTTFLAGSSFTAGGTAKVTLPTGLVAPSGLPLFLSTCFIPAGSMDTLNMGMNCPVDGPNVNSNSNGGTCTSPPTLVNVVKLADDLQIFVEPTGSLVTSWFYQNIYEMRFSQPQFGVHGTKTFSTGQAGDIVVLKKIIDPYAVPDCSDVYAVSTTTHTFVMSETAPASSAKFALTEGGGESMGDEKGGVASVKELATGKVNELPTGRYTICYATKNSEGDDASDFSALTKTIEILPSEAVKPSMSMVSSILLGSDIVVHWDSTIKLRTRLQPSNSWIGLYRQGDCMPYPDGGDWNDAQNKVLATQLANTQYQFQQEKGKVGKYVEQEAHTCFLAYQYVEEGVSSGTVRFSQSDYGTAETFDVRFFHGDTRNGQGHICRGLSNVPSETFVQCNLEAAVISGPIHVQNKMEHVDDPLEALPGMEFNFDSSNRGTKYKNTPSL